MSLIIDNEKAKVTCGTCNLFPCSCVPEKEDKACDDYIPPYFDYMITDADQDQCAVVGFIAWSLRIEYIVIINGVREFESDFRKGVDTNNISVEISKVLALICNLPESDMYLQVLQAIDGLKEQEWYP